MGNGIAHVFAQKDFKVTLIDVNAAQLERALATIAKNFERQVAKGTVTAEEKEKAIKQITPFQSIAEGVKDAFLVVEAATENTELKLNIFREMDAHAPSNCILATNTSSISITKIAAATKRPQQVIGMHFMNPVPVMKLVEFIANRILMPMINEAIYSLFEGVAGVEEIDTVMKLGMAHPMGPLQLADFIGLDVCLAILRVLHEGFGNPKYAPCPLLVNMVTAGKLGVKNGEGFYVHTPGSKELIVSPSFQK